MQNFSMTIGGKQIPTKESFEIFNPATGELVANCPNATMADLDNAVAAAKAAFPAWSALPDAEGNSVKPLKALRRP